MASFSNAPAPTGILRRRSSVDSASGKGGIAKIKDIERHLGSPTSRTGVHFEAPLNLSELLHRAASSDKNGPVNRKVLNVIIMIAVCTDLYYLTFTRTNTEIIFICFSRLKKSWKVL